MWMCFIIFVFWYEGLLQLWYWRFWYNVDFFFRLFVDFIFVDFDKILNKFNYFFDIFLGNYFLPALPSKYGIIPSRHNNSDAGLLTPLGVGTSMLIHLTRLKKNPSEERCATPKERKGVAAKWWEATIRWERRSSSLGTLWETPPKPRERRQAVRTDTKTPRVFGGCQDHSLRSTRDFPTFGYEDPDLRAVTDHHSKTPRHGSGGGLVSIFIGGLCSWC